MRPVVSRGGGRQTCKHKKMRQASSSSSSSSYFQVELLHTLAHTQSASLRVCALEWGSFIFSWRRCCSNLRRTCSSKKALKECRQQACVCGVCVCGVCVCGVCVFCLVLLSLICSLALMCRLSAGDVATRGGGQWQCQRLLPRQCPPPSALCPLPFIYVGHAALTEGCLLPALRLSCDNRARRAPLGSLLGSSSSSSSRAAPALLRPARQV